MTEDEIRDLLAFAICRAKGIDPTDEFCGSFAYDAWEEGHMEWEDFFSQADESLAQWNELRSRLSQPRKA